MYRRMKRAVSTAGLVGLVAALSYSYTGCSKDSDVSLEDIQEAKEDIDNLGEKIEGEGSIDRSDGVERFKGKKEKKKKGWWPFKKKEKETVYDNPTEEFIGVMNEGLAILKEEKEFGWHEWYTEPRENSDTAHFGYRIHPIKKKRGMHTGIDVRSLDGKIYSIGDGEVFAMNKSGYTYKKNKRGRKKRVESAGGKSVTVDYGEIPGAEGWHLQMSYCHLSRVYSLNGYAEKGDKVGPEGETGLATGPHLHLTTKLYKKSEGFYDDFPVYTRILIDGESYLVDGSIDIGGEDGAYIRHKDTTYWTLRDYFAGEKISNKSGLEGDGVDKDEENGDYCAFFGCDDDDGNDDITGNDDTGDNDNTEEETENPAEQNDDWDEFFGYEETSLLFPLEQNYMPMPYDTLDDVVIDKAA